jgi:hypothetical protein
LPEVQARLQVMGFRTTDAAGVAALNNEMVLKIRY